MKLNGIDGNDALRRRLAGLRDLTHAYLIDGGSPASRRSLAENLAGFALCIGVGERPCGVCMHCRKLREGLHPDVTVLSPLGDKREIGVDQIRGLSRSAYTMPNEGARSVYVIDDASMMNERAQNALLKLLEEPPQYVLFLLCASAPERLLQTVRSRVQTLTLEPETEDAAECVSDTAREVFAAIAAGDELRLACLMVGLEKAERKELVALFGGVTTLAGAALRDKNGDMPTLRLVSTIDAAENARREAERGVGVGILTGAFAARCFS